MLDTHDLSANERLAVRETARTLAKQWTFDPHGGTTRGEWNRAFSEWLGSQGWIGSTIPPELGGHERGALARLMLVEELLAVGAPMAAHWIAERQVAPSIVHFGSDELKRRVLPGIASGQTFVSIGLSEPDAGSDLAALATKATRTEDGWLLQGSKIWTSDAQRNDMIQVLCRTDTSGGRHEGFTSLLVELPDNTVTIRPIAYHNGEDYYAEVFFDQTFVPDSHVIGEPGSAWSQLTSELVNERAGAERYMATYPLIEQLVEHLQTTAPNPDRATVRRLGKVYATTAAMRLLAMQLASGGSTQSVLLSSSLKDAGTLFEQDCVEWVRDVLQDHPNGPLETAAAWHAMKAPLYTLGGGSTEVLRSGIGKRLIRTDAAPTPLLDAFNHDAREAADGVSELLSEYVASRRAKHDGATPAWDAPAWEALREAGWHLISLSEELGGAGGSTNQVLGSLYAAGANGVTLPSVHSWLTVPAILAVAGITTSDHLGLDIAFLDGPAIHLTRQHGNVCAELGQSLGLVAWAQEADSLWVNATLDGQSGIALLPKEAFSCVTVARPLREPAGEVTVLPKIRDIQFFPCNAATLGRLRAIHALGYACLLQGAAEQALSLSHQYVRMRSQFGRPVAEFQLVQLLLVEMVEAGMLSSALIQKAAIEVAEPDFDFRFLAGSAKSTAGDFAKVTAHHAHQAFGAIGTTIEHELHHLTQRLYSWRSAAGTEQAWLECIGQDVLTHGAVHGWELITGLR